MTETIDPKDIRVGDRVMLPGTIKGHGEFGVDVELDGARICRLLKWPELATLKAQGQGGAVELRDLIAAAYEAGCWAVHEHYEPDVSPTFSEAASEYAASINLPTTGAPVPAEVLDRLTFAAREDVLHSRYGVNEFVPVSRSDLRALLAASPAPPSEGWRDIASAPECEVIVVTNGDYVASAAKNPTDWGDHYWSADDADNTLGWAPTHWMPLPAPPANGGA